MAWLFAVQDQADLRRNPHAIVHGLPFLCVGVMFVAGCAALLFAIRRPFRVWNLLAAAALAALAFGAFRTIVWYQHTQS